MLRLAIVKTTRATAAAAASSRPLAIGTGFERDDGSRPHRRGAWGDERDDADVAVIAAHATLAARNAEHHSLSGPSSLHQRRVQVVTCCFPPPRLPSG